MTTLDVQSYVTTAVDSEAYRIRNLKQISIEESLDVCKKKAQLLLTNPPCGVM